MRTIALLTDYGMQDPYVGIMKGVMATMAPQAVTIDITHMIEPQNIRHGAVYLGLSFSYFPKGTIFLCVVDPGVGTSRKIIAAKTKEYFFIAPDNGLLTDVLKQETIEAVYAVDNPKYYWSENVSATFHGRDIMAPVAAHLAKASHPSTVLRSLGPKLKQIHMLAPQEPKIFPGQKIVGQVIYFDHFGNAITNIRRWHARPDFWKSAEVKAGASHLGVIRKTYAVSQKPLALWNSFDHLEIAVPCGSAKSLLNRQTKVEVSV